MTDLAIPEFSGLPVPALIATLAATALLTLLAYLAWRALAPPPVDALTLARIASVQDGRRAPGSRSVVEDVRAAMSPHDGGDEIRLVHQIAQDRFRHPVSTPVADLPTPLRITILVLGAAAAYPRGIPPETASLLVEARQAILSGRDIPPLRMIPPHRVIKEIDVASNRHGWWETVAVALMVKARSAGSWIVPADIEPLLTDEPSLLDALTAPTRCLVPPDGAPLVSHWQAETMGGSGLYEPWVQDCVRGLGIVSAGRVPR